MFCGTNGVISYDQWGSRCPTPRISTFPGRNANLPNGAYLIRLPLTSPPKTQTELDVHFCSSESEGGPRDVQMRPWSGTGPVGEKSPQHLLGNRKTQCKCNREFGLELNLQDLLHDYLCYIFTCEFKQNVSREDSTRRGCLSAFHTWFENSLHQTVSSQFTCNYFMNFVSNVPMPGVCAYVFWNSHGSAQCRAASPMQ